MESKPVSLPSRTGGAKAPNIATGSWRSTARLNVGEGGLE